MLKDLPDYCLVKREVLGLRFSPFLNVEVQMVEKKENSLFDWDRGCDTLLAPLPPSCS